MIANFSQELYKKLIQNGFNTIRGFYENATLDNNTKFIGLLKEDGASWYAVIIINMENISVSEFNIVNADYTKFFENIQKRYAAKSVFITNIMISEKPISIVDSFIENLEEFIHQPVNNIYWGINIENGELALNKNQPTEVLNLRTIIDETYEGTKHRMNYHNYGKDFDTLRALAYDESLYKQKEQQPYVVYGIMIINLIVILAMELSGGSTDIQNLILFGAIEPNLILNGGEFYRLFTAMFIHVGFTHFAHNTLALYVFGTRVEKYYGRLNFITIYILGGAIGSVFSLIFTRSISAGASGAIFSLIGATAVMAKIWGRDVDGLSHYTMTMYIMVSIGFGLAMPNVDNFGHLGGLLGGVILGYIICKLSEKSE